MNESDEDSVRRINPGPWPRLDKGGWRVALTDRVIGCAEGRAGAISLLLAKRIDGVVEISEVSGNDLMRYIMGLG